MPLLLTVRAVCYRLAVAKRRHNGTGFMTSITKLDEIMCRKYTIDLFIGKQVRSVNRILLLTINNHIMYSCLSSDYNYLQIKGRFLLQF